MSTQVYLDNAATTPLEPRVKEVMIEAMEMSFGNPSSIHAQGRQARTLIEKARKQVAQLLNAAPAEIFFTSGGTESDNTAICRSVFDLNTQHIISSPTEHHAVIHTIDALVQNGNARVSWLDVNSKGEIDLLQLEDILKKEPHSLISLMHGNNEIGTLHDIYKISELAKEHGAIFHSDTVQTVGHFNFDVQDLKINFLNGSAHKFHGPKGVGFLYINQDTKIKPFIQGGAQERNMRGGTENVMGILGLAKALEIAHEEQESNKKYIKNLKNYAISQLKRHLPEVEFNGIWDPENSLYTVLNVSLPLDDMDDMLLFSLDIAGICVSGGSACSSGTNIGSHVLEAIKANESRPSIRISFSKYNTTEEIDILINKLMDLKMRG